MKTHALKPQLPLFVLLLFQVTMFVTAEAQQTVHGCVPQYIKELGMRPLARLDSTKRLNLVIGLSLQNSAALTNLLQDLYDPASPNFRHWLTPDQFTAQFGPSEQDYDAVVNYVKANGLAVSQIYHNRMLVDVIGTVRDIEKTFHLKMMVYYLQSKSGTFYAPDSDPTLDLSIPIAHISGLRNDLIALSHAGVTSGHSATPLQTSGTGSLNGLYISRDFRAAYAPGVSLNGSGQTVGLVAFDGFYYTDISNYETNTQLPTPYVPVDTVLIDGADGFPSGTDYEKEVTLDIEMAMAMAPGLSRIVVYEVPFNGPGDLMSYFEHILNRMTQSYYIKQFSSSWTIQDRYHHDITDPTADGMFSYLAADGQSFFQGAGDADATIDSTWINAGNTVYSYFGFPSDDPLVTSVGGTTLTTSGPGGSWVSDSVWNTHAYLPPQYVFVGSSGGVSSSYPIPSWQLGANPSNSQVSSSYRNVPDVALTASNIYYYCNSGQPMANCQTSRLCHFAT